MLEIPIRFDCSYLNSMEITREMMRDYLNDALPDDELAAIEAELRSSEAAQSLLLDVRGEIDRGEHSLGGIWRRERLSCPTRDQLGSYILQALDDDFASYIQFHLQTIGCPACQANFDDLSKKQADAPATSKRRKRIVESSHAALKKARS
jgi:hypothetical protein